METAYPIKSFRFFYAELSFRRMYAEGLGNSMRVFPSGRVYAEGGVRAPCALRAVLGAKGHAIKRCIAAIALPPRLAQTVPVFDVVGAPPSAR
jgi:hypothetical protein